MKFMAIRLNDNEIPDGFKLAPDELLVDSHHQIYEVTDIESMQSAIDGDFDLPISLNDLLDLLGFTVTVIFDTDGIEL
jgi:hypothetical protein